MHNTISSQFNTLPSFPSEAQSACIIKALPREVTNAVTRDHFKLIHSAADGFESVKFQFTLPPNSTGAPLHYHLNLVETFMVETGQLEMCLGSATNKQSIFPGKLINVPKGTLHSFNNPHPMPVTFVSEVTPAAEFEKFIRSMYGLANDGKTNHHGLPVNFLQLAVILDFADLYVPIVPPAIQRFARKILAGFARLTGSDQALNQYFVEN